MKRAERRPEIVSEGTIRKRVRRTLVALLPEKPRRVAADIFRKALFPAYGLSFHRGRLAAYRVNHAEPAAWSADHRVPFGTLLTEYSFPHFLLARAVIRSCRVRSWCDLGTGSATLPFQVARLGLVDVFGIDGSDAAVRAGKVRLPLSNFCVADITSRLEIRGADGAPAFFEVVSALELVEHIPDAKLDGLFDNIRRLRPKYVMLAVGLQPDPPYHINLKPMAAWLEEFSSRLPGWAYDDRLSAKIYRSTRCNHRFTNAYPTNHLAGGRNLVIYVREEDR